MKGCGQADIGWVFESDGGRRLPRSERWKRGRRGSSAGLADGPSGTRTEASLRPSEVLFTLTFKVFLEILRTDKNFTPRGYGAGRCGTSPMVSADVRSFS